MVNPDSVVAVGAKDVGEPAPGQEPSLSSFEMELPGEEPSE